MAQLASRPDAPRRRGVAHQRASPAEAYARRSGQGRRGVGRGGASRIDGMPRGLAASSANVSQRVDHLATVTQRPPCDGVRDAHRRPWVIGDEGVGHLVDGHHVQSVEAASSPCVAPRPATPRAATPIALGPARMGALGRRADDAWPHDAERHALAKAEQQLGDALGERAFGCSGRERAD